MKFFTPIFALVAASAVCANSTENLVNFLKKRNVSLDKSAFRNVSEACAKEINKYLPCFQTPSGPNSDEICKQIMTDECKNFVSNAQSVAPSCKDYPQVMEFISPEILKGTYSLYSFTCTKDESGKPCPLAVDFINRNNKKTSNTKNQTSKELLDTCASDNCRKATYETFQLFTSTTLGAYENLSTTSGSTNLDSDKIKLFLDFLDSDKCKSMANGGAANASTTGANANANANAGAASANANANANANVTNANATAANANASTVNVNISAANNTSANSANDNVPDANSGSSTLKIGTGLFVSLGLLLLSFY